MFKFFAKIRDALDARRQVNAFLSLPHESRNIVFYSEDDFSFMHFDALIRILTEKYSRHVCYLTSQRDDPILSKERSGVHAFYVGNSWSRISLFLRMSADLMIMTMPDLETYHLKRSRVADVHYLYIFHAMVSTHSNYRESAFDNFDTIFLSGPYQRDEIRATERAYQLKEKSLIDYGYPRLDALIDDVKRWREWRSVNKDPDAVPRVMLAPSWGPSAILEAIGVEVVSQLMRGGFHVTVRPHPVTARKRPDVIRELGTRFGSEEKFQLQIDIRDKDTLYSADVLVCDWSGISMEYAFSCERPVVFIDVPKKLNNPNADRIGLVPVETSIRRLIGEIISPQQLDQLPDAIRRCVQQRERYVERISKIRAQYVFNPNRSAEVGARYIDKLAMSLSERGRIR